MRLTVTYPTEEFERAEYFGDHTRETADAHLATMPRGWLEATRAAVLEWVSEVKARKGAQWRPKPDLDGHHRAHSDANGLSWWAVRRTTSDLLVANARGHVCVRAVVDGVYELRAGKGTAHVAEKDPLTLWGEWSPVAFHYGPAVDWPAEAL